MISGGKWSSSLPSRTILNSERMMMQVSVEDINSVKKTLHIEIPEETVVKELDKAYDKLKKKSEGQRLSAR